MRHNMQSETVVDNTLVAAASKVTYLGSGSTVIGWLLSSEFAVLSGLLIGIAGFIVNWYYRREADRREKQLHELRVKRLMQNLESTVPAPLGDV